MEHAIRMSYTHSLADFDVEKITRNQANVMLYKDLLKFSNIVDAIGQTNQMILLFPVESDTEGHWIALIHKPDKKTIVFFDPYGFSPQQELGYTSNIYVRKKILNEMLFQAQQKGYKLDINTFRLQKMLKDRNTCGRQSAVRCRFHYLSNKEYAKLMMNQTMSPDFLVTALTFLMTKDDINEEQKLKELLKMH